MPIARLLREQTIGETRWLALDTDGRPAATYLERASNTAAFGARLEGRIGKTDPGAGGTFVLLSGSDSVFLRTNRDSLVPSEGSLVTVEVVSEARAGKLPRVKLTAPDTAPAPSGADAWRRFLNGGETAPVEDVNAGAPVVSAAFEDALNPDVTLPGGGVMHIDRTRALTAADIDSAGRAMKGSAGARALSLNREAAGELARQILLRGLGGLFVLDCVAPVAGDGGTRIRAAFQDTWSGLTTRHTKALAVSQLGLMEASTGWWITPLAERMLDVSGAPTPETTALEGLRQLEKAASHDRMGRLKLALPEAAHAWLAASGLEAQARLAERYGARLSIGVHARAGFEVSPEG
ncbi:ribonuclease E/G [Hyphomonas sp. WL0036]|uniref:ribonuclease E/G n=1 Tax=Hyphomonas sediminis TaxID=2866160 RepID=UPI001C825BCC|nr:ribonuclease E/G [Hyphomonas sediminis]MBY9067537.1 ribonuclease E/G [Hyphomonas sediminis]